MKQTPLFEMQHRRKSGFLGAMTHAHVPSIPWTDTQSPKGKFRRGFKQISKALGSKPDIGPWGGGWPFEIDLFRFPPGAVNYPFHSHSAMWEVYLVTEGEGEVRTPAGTTLIKAGDGFATPPGEPHSVTNTGSGDLVFYVISDNPMADDCHYPDSGKVAVATLEKTFRPQFADYYDGEE